MFHVTVLEWQKSFLQVLSEVIYNFIPEQPVVCAGIRDLRVLKTTQSAFKDFVNDEFRTLPDTDDRIFSTVVTANWWYNTSQGFCFDKAWLVL